MSGTMSGLLLCLLTLFIVESTLGKPYGMDEETLETLETLNTAYEVTQDILRLKAYFLDQRKSQDIEDFVKEDESQKFVEHNGEEKIINQDKLAKEVTQDGVEKILNKDEVTLSGWLDSAILVDWFVRSKEGTVDDEEEEEDSGYWQNLRNFIFVMEMVERYKPILASLVESKEPVCTKKSFICPDNRRKFVASACCSPKWLSVGAPIGLGNECWIDLKTMAEQCDIFSCYGYDVRNHTVGNTNGCTYVPDGLLNYEACVIHDLCYVTPGVTKKDCDLAMEDNINRIYCENVNIYERHICAARASTARYAMSFTDRFFVASEQERNGCDWADTFATRLWKLAKNKLSWN